MRTFIDTPTVTLLAVCSLAAAAGCDRGGGESRGPDRRVKCESPYKYDGRSIEGSASYGKFSAAGNTSVEQVRDVDQAVERYTARYMSLCNDWRNGAITQEQYARESEELRRGMQRLEELMLQLENASSPEEFNETLSAMKSTATLSASNAQLSLDVTVFGKGPADAEYRKLPQGAALGTDAEIYVNVEPSAAAYVYLYQINAAGKLSLLFPDPQIPLSNPLPAAQGSRIPHGQFTYKLDANDLGLENLHVVASLQPLDELAGALRNESGDQPVADNDVSCGTRALELNAPPTCAKTRGLVLSQNEGAKAPEKSMRVAAADDDDALHVVFGFHHVGEHGRFATPGAVEDPLPAPLASAALPSDFESCPSGGAVKRATLGAGVVEKWCVASSDAGVVVDHGPYRRWHANGKLAVEGAFDWGERRGTWTATDPSGTQLGREDY